MVMLDDRARKAAHAIHESAAGYTPRTPFTTVVKRHRFGQFAQGALAAVAVFVFLAAGVYFRPTPDPGVADENPAPVVEETPEVDQDQPDLEIVPDPELDPEVPFDPFDPGPVDETPGPDEPGGNEPPEVLPPVEEPVDVEAPALTITSPKDGERFDVQTIWFEGITEPGATVFAGPWQADVGDDGRWAIKLVLSEGANRASFTATDAAGNEAVASLVVYYDPPPPPPDKGEEEPKVWEFTAHQVYGSCAESPPYDVFWGTGEPGTVISITSEYGAGSTEVNAEGDWEVKVYFETAPIGKVFAVKVKDVNGNKKTFEFVHTEA